MSDGYSGSEEFGLTGIFITATNKSLPFLEIKKDHKLNLFDEVCICGYPSGEQSLDLGKKFSGLRLSPVIQFGRITGFMPTDETPVPYGLQTDIIGTSGSSGSPIVDLVDGKVVGIAQKVLLGKIPYMITRHSDHRITSKYNNGIVKTGLIDGIRIHTLHDLYMKLSSEPDKEIHEFDSNVTNFTFKRP